MQKPLEFSEVVRDAVGHGALEVTPDVFIGVELRGIPRETIRVEPRVRLNEIPHQNAPVLPATVPQEDHRATQVAEQLPKKPDDLGRPDGLVTMEPGVQGDASPARRDADRGDGRDLRPVSSTAQMRRVSPRRPGPDHAGDQQEAALIEERQMGATSCGLFLYATTETASTSRWLLHLSPGRASRASGNSSRVRPERATGGWGDSSPRIACGLPPPRGASSTDPWSSRNAAPPSTGDEPSSASGDRSGAPADPALSWISDRWVLGRGTLRARRRQNSRTNQPCPPQPRGSAPSVATRWRAADVSRGAPGSHEVACPKDIIISITYA